MARREEETDIGATSLQNKLYVPALIFGVLGIVIVLVTPWIGEVGMVAPKVETTVGRWVGFLGEFHPLLLHLPIGALMLVFVMELAGLLTWGRYKANTTLGLFFAGVTSVLAVVFGYCLYLTGDFPGDLVEEHKRDGILFSVVVLATFMLKSTLDLRRNVKVLKPIYALALIASGGAMMSAGHHGGKITHGDPLAKAPWLKDDEEKPDAVEMIDPVVYTDIIHPILEAKCISCHGEQKKKGGLRMDSFAGLLDGGEETDCLVPGDLENSAMITYLHKPLSHDLHMPPEGKTQLTEEEIEILEWWVRIGAPEKKRQSEVEITPAVQEALDSLLTPEEKAAIAAAKEKAEKEKIRAQKEKRKMLALGLEAVNEKFPGSLKYVSLENTDLSFSAVSYRDKFGDGSMDVISVVAGDIVDLDLAGSGVTDEGASMLDRFSGLRYLKLSNTGITDASLPVISGIKQLEVLNLYGTPVSDEGIKALYDMPNLKRVYLWDTRVTDAGAAALEENLRSAYVKAQGELPEEERERDESLPEVLLGM